MKQSHYTVGDFMKRSKTDYMKSAALLGSVVVYIAMLLWTGLHNYNLLAAGAPEGLRFWGFIGFIALEVNAIALPLALHSWTHATAHRNTALLLYGLDLALLFFNTVLDYSMVAGTGLLDRATWMQAYRDFILPATPIFAGIVWPILWMLDPAHKQRQTLAELQASTQEALAQRIVEAASGLEVETMVEEAARQLVLQITRQTLALPVPVSHNGKQAKEETEDKEGGTGNPTPPLAGMKVSPSKNSRMM